MLIYVFYADKIICDLISSFLLETCCFCKYICIIYWASLLIVNQFNSLIDYVEAYFWKIRT